MINLGGLDCHLQPVTLMINLGGLDCHLQPVTLMINLGRLDLQPVKLMPKTSLLLLLLLLHPFNGLFSRTSCWVSRYQKGKTSLDFNEARDDSVLGWQWHQLHHVQTVCTSVQTDNHTNNSSLNFLQAGCSSWRPTNSVIALKAQRDITITLSHCATRFSFWDPAKPGVTLKKGQLNKI